MRQKERRDKDPFSAAKCAFAGCWDIDFTSECDSCFVTEFEEYKQWKNQCTPSPVWFIKPG